MIEALWLHFFGDFICQTDTMAINKSHSNKWLTAHVLAYTPWLLFFGWKVALLNGAAHWLIDFVTSRINSKLWAKGLRHWFFVCVGFDQALHLSLLLWSIKWLQ